MKYPVYAVRDVHVGFLTPMVDQNDASALRNFSHACMNKESLYNSHPKDFSLYRIGEFNTDDGSIEACIPELITDAFSVL